MYLPKLFKDFTENYPEVQEKYKELSDLCSTIGPLDKKTQELVKFGLAVGTNSRGGVMSHTRKALLEGATKEEVMHVILLSLTAVGFPHMMAAVSWVHEVLEEMAS
ncbi:MAG: carboxymuconolactone decarboxylase family protein [Deltaproteobacteria bacterium]|nr:carboxymuconolactone decarboxylase family protein [Deltaproteobacteria bacterium]